MLSWLTSWWQLTLNNNRLMNSRKCAQMPANTPFAASQFHTPTIIRCLTFDFITLNSNTAHQCNTGVKQLFVMLGHWPLHSWIIIVVQWTWLFTKHFVIGRCWNYSQFKQGLEFWRLHSVLDGTDYMFCQITRPTHLTIWYNSITIFIAIIHDHQGLHNKLPTISRFCRLYLTYRKSSPKWP